MTMRVTPSSMRRTEWIPWARTHTKGGSSHVRVAQDPFEEREGDELLCWGSPAFSFIRSTTHWNSKAFKFARAGSGSFIPKDGTSDSLGKFERKKSWVCLRRRKTNPYIENNPVI
eukprot:scaffold3226_cov160-Amphora_coffeaeformis.AAC.21